jgi:NADPH:quinone reductase-like Zn-dependent oxidoreductase
MPRLHVKFQLPITPGWDVAGIVEEIGDNVTTFKKGDKVYGIPNFPGQGGYAEYVAADAGKFALKPKSLSFNQAAAVPVSSIAAWDGIIKGAQVQSGQRVLIHGAAGNVGHFAVQFAKVKGAYVIGTASAENFEFLEQLGIDEIIDYQNQRFEEVVQNVDVVFDAAVLGAETQLKSIQIMNTHGTLATTQGYPLHEDVIKALAAKNAKGHVIYGENRIHGWLTEIAGLIDENKVSVAINSIFPLEQVGDAHRSAAEKRKPGKLILEVREEN